MSRKSASGINGKSVEIEPVKLPKPKEKRSLSVFSALRKRKTVREIGGKKIPLQILSNLLWAADGVNRKNGPFGIGGRTAASASNSQEIDIYVVTEAATFLYDASQRLLVPLVPEDLRPLALGKGQPDAAPGAPLRLVYVADIDKLAHTAGFQEPGLQNPEVQKSYYFIDAGIIAGNVYLYAASVGLAAWFHNCNRTGLQEKLRLRADQRVLFGQTVGYAETKKR
jgi:nitroreductase